LVKVNGDTVWGKIKLKNKIFHVSNADPVEISADEVKTIKAVIIKAVR
ncbi:MAG: hypothetical protein IPL50_20930, partial [Chitinophagaceae bacterium]|nr:hypothetical protein [Chitinophagaceae bacterium]